MTYILILDILANTRAHALFQRQLVGLTEIGRLKNLKSLLELIPVLNISRQDAVVTSCQLEILINLSYVVKFNQKMTSYS